MEVLFQRARTFAQETAKISQDLAKEAAKLSHDLALETAKRSKELAIEATKKADQLKALASGEASVEAEVQPSESESELESYGITPELREFVKGFNIKTFREFPLQDLDKETNGSQDLTEWQETHAVLLLKVNPEISDFRYVLCPRRMTESRFWRIYFKLVENFIAPYQAKANISADKAVAEKGEVHSSVPSQACETSSSTKVTSTDHDLDAYLLSLEEEHGDDASDTELDKLINSASDEDADQDQTEASSDGVLVEIPSEDASKPGCT